jgi:hypothetical protein
MGARRFGRNVGRGAEGLERVNFLVLAGRHRRLRVILHDRGLELGCVVIHGVPLREGDPQSVAISVEKRNADD